VDLYKVSLFNNTYYYSSGVDVTFLGTPYVGKPINRTEITVELQDSDIRITAPLNLEPFSVYITASPSSDMSLTLYDYDSGFEMFSGILISLTYKIDTGVVDLKFQKKESFFDSEVPYRTYGTLCSFDLYSAECGVQKADNQIVTATFTLAEDRRSVTVPGISGILDNTYRYGVVGTDTGETSFIISQVGTTVVFDTPLFIIPSSIYLIKGCDKSFSGCGSNFNNSIRYGGFPVIPAKNPVTESI
jgi:hypothetical protein